MKKQRNKGNLKTYFRGVKSESKKVEWPKGKELANMTFTVLSFGAIFAVIFLIMDFGITAVLNLLLG